MKRFVDKLYSSFPWLSRCFRCSWCQGITWRRTRRRHGFSVRHRSGAVQ